MKKIFFIILVAICLVFQTRAQNTSGTDFWLTFGRVMNGDNANLFDFRIRIVGGNEPTWVRIDFTHLGTFDIININAHQVSDYILDNAQKIAVYNITVGVNNYSIRITTGKPVSVYAMCGFASYCPTTNVLPVTSIGTEYYQISYLPSNVNTGLDAYAVLATQNNTQVWHNDILEATLNAGDVYYRTEFGDMTGAHINASHPVAFFAINQSADIPPDFNFGVGPLFQQLAPVNTWDKVFFVPVTEIEKDIIRIVASKNGTNITQKGGTVRSGVQGAQTNLNGLQAGQFVELYVHLDSAGCFIETNFPVGVCSYIKYNINVGGVFTVPSQTWVPGINQSVFSAKLAPFAFSGTTATHHYALIYTPSPNKAEVSIGGAPPSGLSGGIWHHNAISGVSFYSMPLTNHYTTYTFTNPDGITIFGYGVSKANNTAASYYYLAYSAMRDLDAAFFANDIHFQDLEDNPICESEITFRAEIEGLAPPSVAERIKWYVNGEHQPAGFNQETWSRSFSAGEYEIRMWVRYENNDTVNKIGTLKICNLDAAFFANEVHNEVLPDTTFCNKTVLFRAETGALSTEPGHIRWYIDYNDGNGYVEESAGLDQTQWSKDFANGTYPVKMWVLFENGEDATITSTLKIQTLWIKIRNVRY